MRQRQDWLIETAEHARANARREFGNVGLVIEVTRDMWGWASPERLIQDLRFGVRMLRKNPAPSATHNLKVIAWRHLGFGGGTGGIYSSDRVSMPVADAKADEQRPSPDEPFQADLGGGITALIPLALYVNEEGTLPKAQAALKEVAPRPTAIRFSANDRATRLGATALAWNVFQHFYPYFDVAQTDWNAALKEAMRRAATDANAEAFGRTLKKARKAFITDGRAISYAESCMGIVEHYKLAEIVGAPTAGTNGNIIPFKLPGGYSIRWTGMRVLKHDGAQHHGVGILPTVPVVRTRAAVAAGRDEFLERAIEVVKNAEK